MKIRGPSYILLEIHKAMPFSRKQHRAFNLITEKAFVNPSGKYVLFIKKILVE